MAAGLSYLLLAETPEFKRARRKAPPMHYGNWHRGWVRCPACKKFMFFDYVPGSLSRPIITVSCCAKGDFNQMTPVAIEKQKAGGKRVTIERFGHQKSRREP